MNKYFYNVFFLGIGFLGIWFSSLIIFYGTDPLLLATSGVIILSSVHVIVDLFLEAINQ